MSAVKDAIEREAKDLWCDLLLLCEQSVVVATDDDARRLCSLALTRIARLAAIAATKDAVHTYWGDQPLVEIERQVISAVLGEEVGT